MHDQDASAEAFASRIRAGGAAVKRTRWVDLNVTIGWRHHPETELSMDVRQWQGTAAFGKAYQYMLENDTHAKGSVDTVLARSMVRLCDATAGFLYEGYTPRGIFYSHGSRPDLERVLAQIIPPGTDLRDGIKAIVSFTASLGDRAPKDLDNMVVGGREEHIIQRGSDWCADIARVACVLCQVAGIPARIVCLFDLERAYSGHVIIEVYRDGKWDAADSLTGVLYETQEAEPLTAWDLMRQPGRIARHDGFYSQPGQFRAAAITNYFCWQLEQYNYATSGLNAYYRSILEMSAQGWPGGLRWLHGEESLQHGNGR
jgi:hypothetical protein